MDVQNAGLGEHRLRDLNDEINKLIREKGHWERRIVELGGPNYAKAAPRATGKGGAAGGKPGGRGEADDDDDAPDAPMVDTGGYRYFGAAKSLPGVRELFQKVAPRTVRRTRHQMLKAIDADYYGYRDEEDGVLEKVEAVAEASMREAAVASWEAAEAERAAAAEEAGGAAGGGAGGAGAARARARQLVAREEAAGAGADFVAHVPLPDPRSIEQLVLDRKKRDLLNKYASEGLQAEEEEARELLNKRARV